MIGKKIRAIRIKRELTQPDVAEAAGISYIMLGLIERNKANPSVATLDKIAQALKCSLVIDIVEHKKASA